MSADGEPAPPDVSEEVPGLPEQVRLRVELVVEIADSASLAAQAREQLAADSRLPARERAHAVELVSEDPAEALAYLVEPFDLVKGFPGVELAQASWDGELLNGDDLEESDEESQFSEKSEGMG